MGPFSYSHAGSAHLSAPACQPLPSFEPNGVESTAGEHFFRSRGLIRNPSEPIERKLGLFNEMCRVLINRTHWSYVDVAQVLTAKKSRILWESVRSRTRIQPESLSEYHAPKRTWNVLWIHGERARGCFRQDSHGAPWQGRQGSRRVAAGRLERPPGLRAVTISARGSGSSEWAPRPYRVLASPAPLTARI